jgi:hypothetical protein
MGDKPRSVDSERVHRSWTLHRVGIPKAEADDAFNNLQIEHQQRLERYARHPDADEIVNVAFLREFLLRGTPPPPGHFFYRTMMAHVFNVRRNVVRSWRQYDEIPDADAAAHPSVEQDLRHVRLLNEAPQLVVMLKEAFPDMPVETMRHIILRMSELAPREIAVLLEISPHAESKRWERIRNEWGQNGDPR